MQHDVPDMHGISCKIRGIMLFLGCTLTATSSRWLLLQRTQLRRRPLTVTLTCCMEWSMQMAMGTLQESMVERADLDSYQVSIITSSLTHISHCFYLLAFQGGSGPHRPLA